MLSWLKERTIDLLLAIFAGICISVGGAVYFSCPNKIVGSFLFGLGLCTIIFFKLNLFTGKVGYIPAYKPVYLLQLLLIWVGNFIGVYIGALLQKLTRIGDALVSSATSVTAVKLEDDLVSLFVLGIFCGLMMYIAVEGSKRVPAGSAVQLAIILLPVAVFILCGFEHCIADLYYFALTGFTPSAWLRIVIITAGNSLGSVLLHLVANLRKEA